MGDTVKNALLDSVGTLLYHIEKLLCNILDILHMLFGIFAGVDTISYKGNYTFLTNFLVDEFLITKIFWAMALVSILVFAGSTIRSSIKKNIASNNTAQIEYKVILTRVFKTALFIFIMSAVVNLSLFTANILVQQVSSGVSHIEEKDTPVSIEFENEDYATMFRILDKVEVYSVNPSFDSTYNINTCFNSIRHDLQILEKKGFFQFNYEAPKNSDGINVKYSTWQKAIRSIGVAADINQDLMIDEYNPAVSKAIIECAELIKKDASFKPLASYTRNAEAIKGFAIGRTILLASSFNAANNVMYNEKASIYDDLRRPYFTCEKDIYDINTVLEDFSLGVDKFNHVIAILVAILLIIQFIIILINFTLRLINMLGLYLIAPPFIVAINVDDGKKFKKWVAAFAVQVAGIFGIFITISLTFMLIPIILKPGLAIFDSPSMDISAKLLIVVAIAFVATRFTKAISKAVTNSPYTLSMKTVKVNTAVSKAVSAVAEKAGKIDNLQKKEISDLEKTDEYNQPIRIIPDRTKAQTELFKHVSILDMVVGLACAVVTVLTLASSIPVSWIFALIEAILSVLLIVHIDKEPKYLFLFKALRHFVYNKNYKKMYSSNELVKISEDGYKLVAFQDAFANAMADEVVTDGTEQKDKGNINNKAKNKAKKMDWHDIEEISPFTVIEENCIHYGNEYYGAVIEIPPVSFDNNIEAEKNVNIGNALASILKNSDNQFAINVLKIEKPVLQKDQTEQKEIINSYYMVMFDKEKEQLSKVVDAAMEALQDAQMLPRRIANKELALFLKYTNEMDFDENSIAKMKPEDYADWAMPDSVEISRKTVQVNKMMNHNMRIIDYPSAIDDAWLASVLRIPSTKVVIKATPMTYGKSIYTIERAIEELQVKYESAEVEDNRQELQTRKETLQVLLEKLKSKDEKLLNVNIYITAYDPQGTDNNSELVSLDYSTSRVRKENMEVDIRKICGELGFRLDCLEFDQTKAYVASQVSGYDPFLSDGRGMPANTIAAAFPWICTRDMNH